MPWIDANRKVFGDDDAYTTADGTQYPGNWDKASLGLTHVDRPAEPSGTVVTDWHVDDANQWVWETRPFNTAELNAPILAQIAVLDTYIPRGLEDLITGLAFDVTKLPQIQQQRLAQKAALRLQLVK